MGTTLISIARFLCGLIDSIVYKVISKMFELFYEVANIILYSEEAVDAIGQRIALILGIFMLFRIAVSLISYLISPDKLSDNSKGGAKLITNIIVSLVLLSTINIIFVEAYKVQIKVIDSKIIEKIFFGKKATVENVDMAYILYSSFVTPSDPKCIDLFDPYKDITDECANSLSIIKNNDVINTINNDVLRDHRIDKLLSNYDTLNYQNAGVYVFDYLPIISTISGVIVVLVLISFSMELAKRAIKLFFLQIIAPIPIIANIDPGKGSEVFKKWSKETINTYISIFLRIIIINFAIFMITLVKNEFYYLFEGKSVFLTVILVIGCLLFAKQVPKLIEDMLGIKLDGMTLKPIKKFQEQALFGKQITSLGAAGLAGGAAFAANTYANKGNIFSGIAGAGSAFARGTVGAFKGQNFGQVYKGAYGGAMTARTNRDDRQELGISTLDVWGENIRKSLHVSNTAQKNESELKNLDEYVSAGTAAKQRAEGEVDKKADMIKYNGQSLGAMRDYYEQLKNGGPQMSDSINAIKTQIKDNHARAQGETDEQYEARIDRLMQTQQQAVADHYQNALKAHAEATAKAHGDYFKARKAITNAYIKNGANLDHNTIDIDANTTIEGFHDAFSGAYRDEIVESNINKMETLNKAHDMNQPINRSNIGESIQRADDARSKIRGSDEYGKAQLIQQQAAKEKK